MWKQGKLNGCEYWVKSFDEPSVFGVNEGRISKLTVKRDGREVINFDRAWDIEPQTDEDREVLDRILEMYN